MIPNHLLFELVDAQVAFKVTKKNTDGELSVSRARNGKIRLSDRVSYYEDDAPAILNTLKYLVCQELMGPLRLDLKFDPSFDAGQIVDLTITPELAKGQRSGYFQPIAVRSVVLAAGDLQGREVCIYEATLDRRQTLHCAMIADGEMADVMQLSRHAMPEPIHRMIVGAGMTWDGAPHADKSYAKLYGEDRLEQVIAEDEAAHNAYVGSLMGMGR
ncbi:hypothetical protein [Bosea sp. RAC05]|uniref:hypothetical protein n=1 Tax=Bosea sp. RAC05 TaxID=1842539 RepID=UPI00083DC485|nr:hypothetical protein [Bosea sp. RAC05]AOG03083.1 hypothetical protein BSY19_5161 [Bosea sp. RAC05]